MTETPQTPQTPESPAQTNFYVTRTGLPITIELHWPFKLSGSGADFWVLHANVDLVSQPELNAFVSVNMAVTLHEALNGDVSPQRVESPAVNAIRKEVDNHQVEFLKSSKLIPIPFGSRHYNIKRGEWQFGAVQPGDAATLLTRTAYWLGKSGQRAWMANPADALYLATTTEALMAEAGTLAAAGLIQLEGEWATATPALLNSGTQIESAAAKALEELQLKHAYERG